MNAERSAQESLLGVGPNASAEDIRAAYRRQLDRLDGQAGPSSEERFLQLRRAHDRLLRDRTSRSASRDRRDRVVRAGGRAALVAILFAVAVSVVLTQLTDFGLLTTRHAPGTTLRLVGHTEPYGTVVAFESEHSFHAGPPARAYEIRLRDSQETIWLTERIVENGMEPVPR